jgi:hypothetical protein
MVDEYLQGLEKVLTEWQNKKIKYQGEEAVRADPSTLYDIQAHI